jgi:hypothetical protein
MDIILGGEIIMPKTIQRIKCKECNDEFEAVSGEFTRCKCGLNSVKACIYSTEYETRNGMGMNFERISSDTFIGKIVSILCSIK